jgi:dihydrofolate reductase
MRKVMLGMQVSLDGYVATVDGGLDWAFGNFDAELGASAMEALSQLDTALLGRANYEEQAAAWPNREGPMADIMNNLNKIVFSRTLEQVEWVNSRLATGTPAEEIARLKQQPGKEIGVAGGARFAQSLSKERLVDEYRLTIHPVALGRSDQAQAPEFAAFVQWSCRCYLSARLSQRASGRRAS